MLPAGVRWTDRQQNSPVAQQVKVPLSLGSIHRFERPSLTGRPVSLDISRPYSWLYQDKYQALSALQIAGAELAFQWVTVDPETLIYTYENYTVAFDYDSGAALDFKSIEDVNGSRSRIDRGIFEGQIKLFIL